jgi:2-methylcitrate dehydratase PrpD
MRSTAQLADFAAGLRFADMGEEVAHQCARILYDTVVCSVAGAEVRSGEIFEEAMLAMGGTPEATVFPSGRRTSAALAAFVNAQNANARDLDDNLLYHSHIANTVVPAAVAMAEACDADGRTLLAAIAAGYEVASRVTLSMPGVHVIEQTADGEKLSWPNPFGHGFNTLGAAVAAARVLGLDAEQTAHTLGLAAYSAPVPSMAKATDRDRFAMSKYGAYGWQAWAGCVAARLAAAGMEGDTDALDGATGFWRMMGAASVDAEVMTAGLGRHWWLLQTSFKLEPAGTWMRPALRALRGAMSSGGVQPDEVQAIDVFTRPLRDTGVFHQDHPRSYLDTQVSYHYLLAVTALGVPVQRWHLADVYGDPRVQQMIDRVRLHADPVAEQELRAQVRTPPGRAYGCRTRVEVATTRGRFSAEERYGDGDPFEEATRATDADLDRKYERFAAPALGRNAGRAPAVVWSLEQGAPASALAAAFTSTAPA